MEKTSSKTANARNRARNASMSPETSATMWSNQSKLLWSRLQTISAIEGGALLGSYKVWIDEKLPFYQAICVAILLVATGLLILTGILMQRDADYLDFFRDEAKFERPTGFSGPCVGFLMLFVLVGLNCLLMFYPFITCCSCSH